MRCSRRARVVRRSLWRPRLSATVSPTDDRVYDMNDDHDTKSTVDTTDCRPVLDQAQVERVVGKEILVGLTYVKHSGELIEQRQIHGRVERINSHEGIVIRLVSGAEFRLPPDLRGLKSAPPGTYSLRSTGEEVINPDFLYTWTITRPDA